jgi:hypothetical protein
MSDPTATSEALKQITDAYRVFSLELKAVEIEKNDLVRAVLERVSREKTADIEKIIKEMIYERKKQK